ncbi:ATP-binding protein [Streptomyces sp. NPDC048342]|nr:ATP-binding protein [Streptomyces shenzhenensis]
MPDEPDTLTPAQVLDGTIEHETMLFDRRRTTPSAARSFVAETLTHWGRTERLDDIRLCTSELTANAVLHGAPSGSQILVRVEMHAIVLRIEVHDGGNGRPEKREARTTADDGRGLLLVSAVADHWGVEARQGPGKCVWAVFHQSAAPTCRCSRVPSP